MINSLESLVGHYVTINLNCNKNIYGYVIKTSHSFILLHNVEEFHLDGFIIISKWEIRNIFYSKQEKFRENVFKKSGLLKKVKFDLDFDITNFKRIISQLFDKIIIVESSDEQFSWVFGKLKKYSNFVVKIKEINSFGKNIKKLTTINEEKISHICFDSEYINMFQKYCIN